MLLQKNTVEVTKGTILQNSIYNLTTIDYNAQTIKISILPSYGSNSLYTFSATDEPLVHVKVKISDFSSIGSISFDDIDISGEVFYWCQGSYGLFDETNLSEPITATNANPGSTVSLTYTFENVGSINNNTQYQFDIYAVASMTKAFSIGYVYVTYSSLGLEPYSSANITLSRGEIIMDNTTYDIYLDGYTSHGFKIFSTPQPNANPANLFSLGNTPKKYATIRIRVKDCTKNADMVFDELKMNSSGSQSTYYTGNMPIPFEFYEPIIASDEENGRICNCSKPTITAYSPTIIHGGVGEILTITGTNFGVFDQNCTVLFNNGDNSGPNEIEVGISDFRWDNVIHWTDTEIKLKLPGCDKNVGTSRPPATGKFKVRNSCETSDGSSSNLDIPYSIINYRATIQGVARRIGLQPNTICFSFSNQVPFWVRQQFEIALSDWCSQTGISFKSGPTITKNTPAADGTSLVSFESGSGGYMDVSSAYFANNSCFGEIDFLLRTTLTSPTTADEENMRELIKHELGHAHMLNHAKGFGQLMHPSGNAGGIITSNDQNGANLVFGASTICGGIGMGGCGGTCTSSLHDDHTIKFQISPNPVSSILNLVSNEESILQVEIINNQGITLKTFVHLKTENALSISDLPAGAYICRVSTKNGISNKMFVKI